MAGEVVRRGQQRRRWSSGRGGCRQSSRIPWAGMSGNQPMEIYYPRARVCGSSTKSGATSSRTCRLPADPQQSFGRHGGAMNRQEGDPDPFTTQPSRASFSFKNSVRAFDEEVPGI